MQNQYHKIVVSLFVLTFFAGCSSTSDVVEEAPVQQASSEPVAAQEPAQPQPEATIALETIFYFDYDDATLRPGARAEIEAHAERIKSSEKIVRIEGHADERGTDTYNKELGQRRAEAVRDLLVSMGVHSSKIETVSLGEKSPVILGSGESVWQKNRRVELKPTN
jgi:peptidoglycan-associated lipoprotein